MATVAVARTELPPGDQSVFKFVWVLTGTDDGSPIEFAQWADRCVQIGSTGDNFGAGTVVWEGSNDGGSTWFTLTDPQTNAISKTAAGIEQVVEVPAQARPRATVAVTSVTVTLVARRQK